MPRFSDQAWAGLGAASRQRVLAARLDQIGVYVSGSAAAGGFDRADANVSRIPLRLDEQGWQRLAAASTRWLAEADAIQADVDDRTADAKGVERIDAGLVLLVFEALPFSERTPG